MSNRFVPPRATGDTAAGGATGSGGYEFSEGENLVFGGLGSAMKIVGILSIVFGALFVIAGCVIGVNLPGLVEIGQGVVLILIGGWLTTAAGSLAAIVTTTGDDIGNLMVAMSKLRSVYVLQAWLMALACIFTVIGLVVGVSAHHG